MDSAPWTIASSTGKYVSTTERGSHLTRPLVARKSPDKQRANALRANITQASGQFRHMARVSSFRAAKRKLQGIAAINKDSIDQETTVATTETGNNDHDGTQPAAWLSYLKPTGCEQMKTAVPLEK